MGIPAVRNVLYMLVALACGVYAAETFEPGGPMTRGRVTTDKQKILSDWGTLLRGACWCQDCHNGVPGREEFAAIKEAGLNSIHVYVEKNDGMAVGGESENMDKIVEWCRQESLYVVMTFGNSHLPSYGKVYDFWKLYGPRYADMTHVIYEIKNEGCSATFHCADDAMKMYIENYIYLREVAPKTHIMLMSHSNLKGGLKSVKEDVVRLEAADVDWTNASYAFHGYAPSAGEQASMIQAMAQEGVAMTCTEFPFSSASSLAGTYEREGISYFWFEACWSGSRTPKAMKGYLSRLSLSWQPDFGNWPQPHVDHSDIPTSISGSAPLRMAIDRSHSVMTTSTLGQIPQGGIWAVYDVTGRMLWRARHGGSVRAFDIPSSLGSRVLLVEYRR